MLANIEDYENLLDNDDSDRRWYIVPNSQTDPSSVTRADGTGNRQYLSVRSRQRAVVTLLEDTQADTHFRKRESVYEGLQLFGRKG